MNKISRLKKVSHRYNEIKKIVTTILSNLLIIPTNNVFTILFESIDRGNYNDISSIEKFEENKEKWIKRSVEILQGRGIL